MRFSNFIVALVLSLIVEFFTKKQFIIWEITEEFQAGLFLTYTMFFWILLNISSLLTKLTKKDES